MYPDRDELLNVTRSLLYRVERYFHIICPMSLLFTLFYLKQQTKNHSIIINRNLYHDDERENLVDVVLLEGGVVVGQRLVGVEFAELREAVFFGASG